MRTLIATLALVVGLGATLVYDSPIAPTNGTAYAQATPAQPQQPPAQINVEINRGGRAWYLNPVWMAIGGIALVLLILLIAMAMRGGGGGTTVVRG